MNPGPTTRPAASMVRLAGSGEAGANGDNCAVAGDADVGGDKRGVGGGAVKRGRF